MKTKTAELNLLYFKKGDDLRGHIESTDNIVEALKDHSDSLLQSSEKLKNLANAIEKYKNFENKFDVQADTHVIVITGPEKWIDELIELDLLDEVDYMDDVFPDEIEEEESENELDQH